MHITLPQRLFVGFSLAKPQIKQISMIQLELAPFLNTTARPVNLHNLHMTLGFLGQVDPTSYLQLLNEIEAMPKIQFSQNLTCHTFWPLAKLVCLAGQATEPLTTMARTIIEIAERNNFYISQKKYTPHVSVFRHVNMPPLAKLRCTTKLQLEPTHLHLYQSSNHSHQVNYSILASWPLTQ
ncbi:RNA 2',3'-cyclic phosphodiesterase [Shewanella algicola]|uniref:RNA 2',3'-cyclic phosphodiesterase n=1 Tax=Shewanella algicola TaxID=640633 RepID=UPI0024943729|nr:RNA 2',3'-cyclic phosphodiesterase [Shewanella algicola]